MTTAVLDIKKKFKEDDDAMDALARALFNAKMQSTYLSNETVASIIVNSLDQADAQDVAAQIWKHIKGKYGNED